MVGGYDFAHVLIVAGVFHVIVSVNEVFSSNFRKIPKNQAYLFKKYEIVTIAINNTKKKIKNLLTNFSLELILFLVSLLFSESFVFCPVYTAQPMAHSVFLTRDPRNNKLSAISGSM